MVGFVTNGPFKVAEGCLYVDMTMRTKSSRIRVPRLSFGLGFLCLD